MWEGEKLTAFEGKSTRQPCRKLDLKAGGGRGSAFKSFRNVEQEIGISHGATSVFVTQLRTFIKVHQTLHSCNV